MVKECGLFPVFEAEHGEVVTGVSKIRKQIPVEEYMRPQRRYAHLFGKTARHQGHRQDPGHGRPQHPKFGLLDEGD
jgi:pyruvate ferredoxin oxidoreductase beta subunit